MSEWIFAERGDPLESAVRAETEPEKETEPEQSVAEILHGDFPPGYGRAEPESDAASAEPEQLEIPERSTILDDEPAQAESIEDVEAVTDIDRLTAPDPIIDTDKAIGVLMRAGLNQDQIAAIDEETWGKLEPEMQRAAEAGEDPYKVLKDFAEAVPRELEYAELKRNVRDLRESGGMSEQYRMEKETREAAERETHEFFDRQTAEYFTALNAAQMKIEDLGGKLDERRLLVAMDEIGVMLLPPEQGIRLALAHMAAGGDVYSAFAKPKASPSGRSIEGSGPRQRVVFTVPSETSARPPRTIDSLLSDE